MECINRRSNCMQFCLISVQLCRGLVTQIPVKLHGLGLRPCPTTLTSSSMQESFRKAKSRLTRFRTFRTPKTPANTRSPQEAGLYERIGDYLSWNEIFLIFKQFCSKIYLYKCNSPLLGLYSISWGTRIKIGGILLGHVPTYILCKQILSLTPLKGLPFFLVLTRIKLMYDMSSYRYWVCCRVYGIELGQCWVGRSLFHSSPASNPLPYCFAERHESSLDMGEALSPTEDCRDEAVWSYAIWYRVWNGVWA